MSISVERSSKYCNIRRSKNEKQISYMVWFVVSKPRRAALNCKGVRSYDSKIYSLYPFSFYHIVNK